MLQTQGQSKEYATGSASTSSRGASEMVYTEAGSLGRAWSHPTGRAHRDGDSLLSLFSYSLGHFQSHPLLQGGQGS